MNERSKYLVITLIILQALVIGILIYFLNPPKILEKRKLASIESKVEKTVQGIDVNEVPAIFKITDAAKIVSESQENSQVYQNAINGDYVLAYSNTLVVFRDSDDKIIYAGDSPAILAQKKRESIVIEITTKAIEAKLVDLFTSSDAQIVTVSDPDKLRQTNQGDDFYLSAEVNDVIVYYPQAKKIVLYRPSAQAIITSKDS